MINVSKESTNNNQNAELKEEIVNHFLMAGPGS